MQKIPVYVVSLERARERRELMKAHLDDLKIDYQFFNAVEGIKLDSDYRVAVNPAKNMSPGVLGCYLSHIQAYEQIIINQIPVALILEDDIVLHYSVKSLVENGCQNLDFDYCFLGSADQGDEGYTFYDANSAVKLNDELRHYQLSSGPYSTFAYLVTLEGAKKRIACALPARTAIDHYHFLPYRPRFRAIIPMLAFMSEQFAVDSLLSSTWTKSQGLLHKHWWFYPLRDLVKLRELWKFLARKGYKFPYAGRWRSFSSSVKVVPRNRLQR